MRRMTFQFRQVSRHRMGDNIDEVKMVLTRYVIMIAPRKCQSLIKSNLSVISTVLQSLVFAQNFAA